MQISWTRLPFKARNQAEFDRGLTDWLSQVFYETLPAAGYEIREEQIFTTFRIAKAFAGGRVLFAEAGAGTGKSFAYLLPAVCYARFTGRPVLIATASSLLQAQLTAPGGDIERLSELLGLGIDHRLAVDPSSYLCPIKGDRLNWERPTKGWKRLHNWTKRTKTGMRSEVPDVPDELWSAVGWDESLPCDTCKQRGTCHPIAARRLVRAATDLVITDHRLFAVDLLSRAERQALGELALLPAYSAVVLDEGHHAPENWLRVQGHQMSAQRLSATLTQVGAYATQTKGRLAEARAMQRQALAGVLVAGAQRRAAEFIEAALAAALPGEGKRALPRGGAVDAAATALVEAIEALQEDLVTEEAMVEGTASETTLRAYSARLDEVLAALRLYRSGESIAWVEGEDLWVVPRTGAPLAMKGPLLFTAATLEPAYMAGALGVERYEATSVGVPFNLGEQVLVYQPGEAGSTPDPHVRAVIEAMGGRSLVLLRSQAEVQAYRPLLEGLPFRVLFEGDAERGAMLTQFRADTASVLVGSSLWEGFDAPGETLSCVIVPRLPFPAQDPLILERRLQAIDRGEDPFQAVDLPEMLIRLKQGAGRLIRSIQDRGVLALLDHSYRDEPWAERVESALPTDAERTDSLTAIARFCPPSRTLLP